MLGRVSSLDWLISIGLLPLSFALTAPVAAVVGVRATLIGAAAAVVGVRATLIGAAAIGGVFTLGALFLPGMRDIEDTGTSTRSGEPDLLRPLVVDVRS